MATIGDTETTYADMLKDIESGETEAITLAEAFEGENELSYADFFNEPEYAKTYSALFTQYAK
jgi:hypothetical protein